MYTLDATIFIRDADPRDPDHATCRMLLEHLAVNAFPIIVPVFVLVEVAGALGRELRDPIRARLFVDAVHTLPTIAFVALDAPGSGSRLAGGGCALCCRRAPGRVSPRNA